MQLNPFAISSLMLILAMLPMTIAVLAKGRTLEARLHSGMNICVLIWGTGAFWFSTTQNPDIALRVWTGTYMAVLFIPVFLFHSLVPMTGYKITKILLPFIYGQAIIFAVLTALGKMTTDEGARLFFDSFYWPIGSHVIYPASFVSWMIIFSTTTIILGFHFFQSRPEDKKPLYLLLAGMPLGCFGGGMNFLPTLGLDIYPYGNFLVPIFYLMLSYALVYHQFLDITIVLKKGIVYVLLIVIISAMYVLSVFMLQPHFGKIFGSSSNMSEMMAALLLGIIFAPMRLGLEQLFDSTIFRSYNDKIAREKQLMEYELVRSEKFKTVSNITKGIIKEIQTPLAAIKTCSEVNRQNLENEEVLRNSAQKIDQQVDHINTLLHQLLKFSNPSSPKTEQANIYDVLEDVFGILKHKMTENNIELETHFNTKNSILLKIDPTQIRQTICNIIINAIEAMPEGGTLSITTSITKSSDTPGTVVGDFFEIDITDTGRGIPPEGLKSVFDPFYSPTAKRAGLGLSIAHRIIKEHKGHIKVKSELNKGSSFIIMLPVTVTTRT